MQTNSQSISKRRRMLGAGLIVFGGLVLVGSAAAKFAQVPKVVMELGTMGFAGNRLTLIAVLEILSALLFLARSTRAIGLLLVSAYLGGAIATHIQHGQAPSQPAFILSLIWLGAWLRHPEVLWNLHASTHNTEQVASSKRQESALGPV